MSRGVEASVEAASVEKVSRNKAKTQEKNRNRSINCREAIEDLGTFSINPPSYQGSVEIAIRNSLRARQIAKCRGGVEEVSRLLKNQFFKKGKTQI